MTKGKKEYYKAYQPQQPRARFWLFAKSCYTEKELEERAWILKTRANSGIHADYLANPNSWFADDSQALINIYEDSWVFANRFKTRHPLNRDEFFVQPVESQRLQWPALYDLMQQTGDYLLIRNKKFPQEQLNQPMNFFLLDLNHILKGISQNSNIKQTKEQLELVTRYVRTIEKNISPFSGSDRLFLANFRNTVDEEIQPLLTHKIESQLLKNRLDELSKTIGQLSTERNRILHFALNSQSVNPHPYTFTIDKPNDLKAYPTQVFKECQQSSTELMEKQHLSGASLTFKQIKDCPNFELINMQEDILNYYAQAITDLNELNHFQTIITQTINLLGQAGEVYTVYQFKEQLSALLKQIDHFIEESAVPIEEIIHANTQAYHKAIQKEQQLSFLKKWLTSESQKLTKFIENQDALAQYPSTSQDLAKTNQMLKQQTNQIIAHLNDPKILRSDFAVLAGQAQELNILLGSMHNWVKVQYELKGLTPPEEPVKLQLLAAPHIEGKAYIEPPLCSSNIDLFDFANPHCFYKISRSSNYSKQLYITGPSAAQNKVEELQTGNYSSYINLIALIPLGLVALYLIYKAMNPTITQLSKVSGNPQEYEKIKTELDDLLLAIQEAEDLDDLETTDLFQVIVETYQQLDKQAHHGIYDIKQLKELQKDTQLFYNELLLVHHPK